MISDERQSKWRKGLPQSDKAMRCTFEVAIVGKSRDNLLGKVELPFSRMKRSVGKEKAKHSTATDSESSVEMEIFRCGGAVK
jgi:hypothetical protein